jgi:hypothetical protein
LFTCYVIVSANVLKKIDNANKGSLVLPLLVELCGGKHALLVVLPM